MPVPFAAGALGLQAVGAGLSIVGIFGKASAQKKLGEMNARLHEQQALYLEEATTEKIRRHKLQGDRLLSSQEQGFAASGVRTSEGSPLEVLYQTSRELHIERDFIRKSGEREAAMSRLQADIARFTGAAAGKAAPWQAAAAGLDAVSLGVRGVGALYT